MDTYIRESKEALLRQIELKEELTKTIVDEYLKNDYSKIIIVASGSSYNSAMCAKNFMHKILKTDVEVISPYTFRHYYKEFNNDFIMVISQSGNSTNAIDALDYLCTNNIKAIGITGNLDSEFKNHSDLLIDYGVGEEVVGYVTKGVITLIYYLDSFALYSALRKGIINMDIFNQKMDMIKNIVDKYDESYDLIHKFIKENYKSLASMQNVYVIGNYSAYAIALEGALKIGETVCIPSFAYESEEFLHGPNLQLTPNYSVFVIDANDETSNRSCEIFKAIDAISDKVYYLANKGISDDKRKLYLNVDTEHDLLPFLYLQYFGAIAHEISSSLNISKHPLLKEFKERIKYKVK